MNPQLRRLDRDAAAVLFLDHQSGLLSLAREPSPEQTRNCVLALADLAKCFSLPTVLSTFCDNTPSGPLIYELAYSFPAAPLIRRSGELNAWDDPDVVAAVRATDRRQLLISGVLTEAGVTSTVLSALGDGFEVFVVADASGSLSKSTRQASLDRMTAAGAQVVDWYYAACELQRHALTDAGNFVDVLIRHVPGYSNMVQNFDRLKIRRTRADRHAASLSRGSSAIP